MKKSLKKVLLGLSVLCISLISIFACSNTQTNAKKPNDKNIVILFTNDVHCGIDDNIGYAGLAEYKKRINGDENYISLVDAGDFSQGAPIGTLSKGKYLVEILKHMGYDFCVPGNHEFDYGMENFLSNCYDLNNMIFSSNFIDLKTNKPVLNPYKIMTFGNKKVAYVGVTTPEALTKAAPIYFQDKAGNYIYSLSEDDTGEKLYSNIQSSVDSARKEGADYVILVGHLGVDGTTDKWKSTAVLSKINGIDLLIDGHSHEKIVLSGKDKNGKDITIAQTGTKFASIGKATIDKDGNFSVELIENVPPVDGSPTEDEKGKKINAKDKETYTFISNIINKYKDAISQVVLKDNKSNLTIYYPNTEDRAVRKTETNLGDFMADAYKTIMSADVALVNGGLLRKSLPLGDITYSDCLNVLPFNNMSMLIKCKGQVIKDALELGASRLPEENGGFLQVAGLKYSIDPTKPSKVKFDDKNNFVSVDGDYRVYDIKVDGKELDLDKYYTIAGHDFLLRNGGDGFAMFKGAEILKDRVSSDVDILADYLIAEGTENYKNETGSGRITIKK